MTPNRRLSSFPVLLVLHKEIRLLSSNPFLLFRYFTWRRIGQPISDRHFHYLSTLSRNIRNGFELRKSRLLNIVVRLTNKNLDLALFNWFKLANRLIVQCFLVIVDLSVIGQESNSMTDSIIVNHEMCHPILFPDSKISVDLWIFISQFFQFLHNLCSISLWLLKCKFFLT